MNIVEIPSFCHGNVPVRLTRDHRESRGFALGLIYFGAKLYTVHRDEILDFVLTRNPIQIDDFDKTSTIYN